MQQTALTAEKQIATLPSIEGIFENGRVKPLADKLPFSSPQKVIIVFLGADNFKPNFQQLTDQRINQMAQEDEKVWQSLEPDYRKVRRQMFQEKYPKLYQKYYASKA